MKLRPTARDEWTRTSIANEGAFEAPKTRLVVADFLFRSSAFFDRRAFIFCAQQQAAVACGYSTVTDLAKLRGLSTSVPRASAV